MSGPLLVATAELVSSAFPVRTGRRAMGASGSVLVLAIALIGVVTAMRWTMPFVVSLLAVATLGLAFALAALRRAREALRSSQARLIGFNRELIRAREEEAARIARELHDDVGQRLALVSIGLSRLRQAHVRTAFWDASDFERLQEQTSAIARSLREISHQLHPAVLEHAGLTSALQSKCEEVRAATDLRVHLADHGDTTDIPRDIALCLFRVTQEALSNVIRHAGANAVHLFVRRDASAVLLQVSDDGRGFIGNVEQGAGLGLRSATERVRSVGGKLTVNSRPGQGTTIRVIVPLEVTNDA